MNFKEMQEACVRTAQVYGDEYDINIDEDFAIMKLYEEVGEFAQAILIHRKQSRPEKHLPEAESKIELGKELSDVVGMAMLNAHMLGIDLEQAIMEKWVNRKK